MRNLVWSRTDILGGKIINQTLSIPQPSKEPWRDYQDVTVLAFPTPLDDSGMPLIPESVKSNVEAYWQTYLSGHAEKPIKLSPADPDKPYWIEVTFPKAVPLRSVEFPVVQGFNHGRSYDPGVKVIIRL